MTDYAEILINMNHLTKKFLNSTLKNKHSEAYLVACEIKELSFALEDWASQKYDER
jgi:hypothetical protein